MEDPRHVAKQTEKGTEALRKQEVLDEAREVLATPEAGRAGAHWEYPELTPYPGPLTPFPFPFLLLSSGLYEWRFSLYLPYPTPIPQRNPIPIPDPGPIRPGTGLADGDDGYLHADGAEGAAGFSPLFFQREELRLDVDGRYPQMTASGTLFSGLSMQVHWIASLAASGPNSFTGSIWYKDGNVSSFPYTQVTIQVVRSFYSTNRKATITFSGGGALQRVRTYAWKSVYFRPDEFEYDTVSGSTAVTSIDTGAHPNRPTGLPVENLSIETVYRRAGLNVALSGGNNVIPLPAAGTDALWSDMEMHDAMQVYWSRFANKPQWSVWTLFAGQHVAVPSQGITPTNLGGIMFDDIGSQHRQGTAVFNGSFINNPPPGDPSPAAAVQRMKFWTAVHELGHTFNLAHSWQKAHPPSWGTPWIPLSNEPEARSFMNYPYNVMGGESAFFADFEYRFSDGELLFMRHAPFRFVQHGNADWFDDHGFQQARVSPQPSLALELRLHRDLDHFEFLEPISIELKLTNASGQPMIVDEMMLADTDEMTVIVKQRGKAARQWSPFARYCVHGDKKVLDAGASMYGSLFVGAGLNGWDLAEPGIYHVQVVLHGEHEDVVSNALRIRVAPPRGYDEEFIAQDFFSEEVGRTLAFHGTRALGRANDTLREVAERCANRRVATHARLALGHPLTQPYKLLEIDGARPAEADKQFAVLEPKLEEARAHLADALTDQPGRAADTLGHIPYTQMVRSFTAFLADAGAPAEAADDLQKAEKTLKKRGVLASVVNDLAAQRKAYGNGGSGKGSSGKRGSRKK